MRPRIFLLVLALTGCESPPAHVGVPAPTLADYSAREDCLYKTTCKMISERGTSPIILDGIAQAATTICSVSLHNKMVAYAASQSGMAGLDDEETEEEIDNDETERHTFAIALDESQACSIQK